VRSPDEPNDADDRELGRLIRSARPRVPEGFAGRVAQGIAARRQRSSRRWLVGGGAALVAAAAAVTIALSTTSAPAGGACRIIVNDSAPRRAIDGSRIDVRAGETVRFECGESASVVLEGPASAEPRGRELHLRRGKARIAGTAAVATTWARVAGTDADTLVDVQHLTEEDDMTKTSFIVSGLAGSVLTVTVVAGYAALKPPEPGRTLRAGEAVAISSEKPLEVAALHAASPEEPGPSAAGSHMARQADARSDSRPAGGSGAVEPMVSATAEPECGGTNESGVAECDPAGCGGCAGCEDCGGCTGMNCGDCPDCAGAMGRAASVEHPERVDVEISGSPSMGKSTARVTIIEFGDFQCQFCEQAMSTVHELAELYPDDVRIVFKQFPMPGHRHAFLAAEASLAAREQGKFWEMHDLLYANRERLDRGSIHAFARELGLDLGRFERALDEHTYADEVKRDVADATAARITGVPTFLINGRVVAGSRPLEFFKEIVEEELRQP
jgi:protein-disulfide isomerase